MQTVGRLSCKIVVSVFSNLISGFVSSEINLFPLDKVEHAFYY